ncbi:MAG: putative glyoxalase/bleomycin resistance protein/dioxygenase [Deltaproteobacteria bacterium]|nr:putative glyoxalase/bleomycin resistance protein/dioxygenase [Deltaproteobacteria bacterium]
MGAIRGPAGPGDDLRVALGKSTLALTYVYAPDTRGPLAKHPAPPAIRPGPESEHAPADARPLLDCDFATDSLDSMIDAWRKAGASVRGGVAEAGAGWQILLQDPSRNVVALFEHAERLS